MAERLGVAFASVNRWERGRTKPNSLAWREIERLEAMPLTAPTPQVPVPLDFTGTPGRVGAVVEAYRLSFGHLFNPAFATEVSAIDPLPHQRLAVYQHMLGQWPLRFMLADDAGAGKTIMTGLYVRESLARRTIRRVIVVPPAGLVGNWRREMRTLFRLPFKVVTGTDARNGNPFVGPDSDLVVVSVDTLGGKKLIARLREAEPYDLVVFDEAHKLSADRDPDFYVRKRSRYMLAEALVGLADDDRWRLGWAAPHLLLLTATPHQGKNYPYYMLWRLLLPDTLTTLEAFDAFPAERRARHFIRRTKEEMVTLDGKPLYPQRVCDTIEYDLSKGPGGEEELYEATTAYMQTYYNRAAVLNRSAAKLAMSVFQRRLASSTWAVLRSFERRVGRLEELIEAVRNSGQDALARRQQDLERRAEDPFAVAADDDADEEGGGEKHEELEAEVLGATTVSTLAELMVELDEIRKLERMARQLIDRGQESKFDKLREFLRDPKYIDEKVIIYTEHRDTAEYLVRRLQGLGHAGEVALIHGGHDFRERDAQVELFRKPALAGGARYLVATDAAAEGINLQFCWLMVNYDIPWNPARLEQRMGRIHRYGQKHDPVIIVNFVAANTREGKVMQTLLHKLDEIRDELGSDKVFDVIGRLFSEVSLTRYLEASLGGEDADAAAARLEGTLTAAQVQALADRERRIYGDGGDVKVELPALQMSLDTERYVALLPGYVRRFLERTVPGLGLRIGGDPETGFNLLPIQQGAMDFLDDALDDLPDTDGAPKLSVRRPDDLAVAWVHPGEPVFDAIADRVVSLWASDAVRGAVFTDPAAEAPYLVHVGRVDISMAPFLPPPAEGELALTVPGRPEEPLVIERRLFAVRQLGDGSCEECAVEHLLLLRGAADAVPGAYQLARQAQSFLPRVEEHAMSTVGEALVADRRNALLADLEQRLDFVRRGFGYQEAELAKRRAILYDAVKGGDARAHADLDHVRERQKALQRERRVKLAEVASEPERVAVGKVHMLARALVLPTTDPEETRDFEARVEEIAMRIAAAHEQARGCQVLDVSKPDLARRAGLVDWPGFDVQSRHTATGERRCIEVKGRAGTTGVDLTENEWAKACNLRAEYWLYVVFDCATPRPRLLKIRDPWGALVWRQRGSIRIDAAALTAAAEQTEAETNG